MCELKLELISKTPPPDDPTYAAPAPQPSRPSAQRAWFPSQHVISYQSGGLPTFNTSQAGGAGAAEEAEAEGVNAWETRYGLRVDMLAAFSYLLGPISGEPCGMIPVRHALMSTGID